MEGKEKFKPDPSLKLMDQVQEVLRYHAPDYWQGESKNSAAAIGADLKINREFLFLRTNNRR